MTWIRNQPDAERISVQLSHSNAELNEEFAQLEQGRVQLEEAADESIMVHSFFRGKKTKLLSDVVVGTVDQLLMAALTQKHVMLRHLGLAGKVVIIDECHAYDAYMNVYMDSILSWLGACHIPVLLLSATLPGKRREELLKAYAGKKATCEEDICASRAYPLISSSESGKIFLHPIHYEKQEREVELRKSTEEEAYVGVRKALDQGGCIGIILNTVKRVQEFAERIKEMFPEAEVWIDHSQFILSDRLKHEEEILKRVGKHSSPEQRRQVIVIGSQVLEQSLDLDFDLLITDLCPMDLLMQRIGRLHRHMRKRPQGLRAARCLVLNCSQTELEKGAEAIYGKYLLLRTESLLPDKIRLPGDISELVQKTYDEEEGRKEYPEACEEFQFQYQKSRRKAKSYCIRRPSRYEGDTISDLLMHDAALTDAKAEMAVRDGIASVEVLVVRQKDFYTAELIAGEDEGTELVMNAEPSYEEAKKIARQRLRLPSRFCQEYCVSQVIEELEDRTCGMVQEWTRHPILAGELIVVLDENNRTVIHNVRLCYDTEKGLLCEEDERGEGI